MLPTESSTTAASTPSDAAVRTAIHKLEGADRIGTAGQVVALAGGAAAGASAAGVVAAAAGASTLLGSTTLAGALGGILVVATPIGWIAGCAAAGAAAAYGVSRLIKSGGRNDRVRQETVVRLNARLRRGTTDTAESARIVELRQRVRDMVKGGGLGEDQANRMMDLINRGDLSLEAALAGLRDLEGAACAGATASSKIGDR